MKLKIAVAALLVCSAGAAARTTPPLRNPAILNIGFVCQWQEGCMKKQERAMARALKYVKKAKPPTWKIQLCNRNASRLRGRVDWIGFNNCIRNTRLKPPRRIARR